MTTTSKGPREELVYLEQQREVLEAMGRRLDRFEDSIRAEIRVRGGLGGVRLG